MTTDRIKEIQEGTAHPQSTSVQQALFQVWNECQQENNKEIERLKSEALFNAITVLPEKDAEIERLKGEKSRKDKLFDLANEFAGDEFGHIAVKLHAIHNTFEQLTKLGFSDKTIGILHLVTHQKDTDYMEYIKAISVSNDATEIKLRDLEDNSNIARLKGLGKKDLDRIEKYHRAYLYLSNR